MKVDSLTLRALDVPFTQAFGHATKDRSSSDAVVVEVASGNVRGYGEGLARDYVTGETVDSVFAQVRDVYWPRVAQWEMPGAAGELLTSIAACLDSDTGQLSASEARAPQCLSSELGSAVSHAARSAVELALVDLWLQLNQRRASELFRPQRRSVTYSGVISSGSVDRAVALARKCRSGGLTQLKIKVGDDQDEQRVAAIREVVGADCSLRVDANAAWDLDTALRKLERMAAHGIDGCEEPLGRARSAELPHLKRHSSIPIILDESLVTLEDARWAAENDACHGFNLRVSKLGGLLPTLRISDIARARGLFCQLGSHVGETSILAAAGRHLAFHLPELRFLEGSFGSLILSQDIASPSLKFGYGGRAEALSGVGMGFAIVAERLREFAKRTWSSI